MYHATQHFGRAFTVLGLHDFSCAPLMSYFLMIAACRVLFASSFNFNKLVYCNTTNAEVEIGAVDKISCMPAISAGAQERRLDRDTPAADASGYAISSEPDTVLRWFEAYAAALTEGHFSVRELYREISHSKGICLYPERPPAMSEAITRGIRVRASPLFVPELSQLGTEGDERQYFFAYRIGFSLLPPGEQAQLAREARQQGGEEGGTHRADHLTQVQLLDRHWIIRNGAGRVQSQVRGEGVVGLFPILQPGGAEFLYQSCTHQPDPEGSMEGTFTFVEGTLENTTGDSIDAACPLFRLDMPPVIF